MVWSVTKTPLHRCFRSSLISENGWGKEREGGIGRREGIEEIGDDLAERFCSHDDGRGIGVE